MGPGLSLKIWSNFQAKSPWQQKFFFLNFGTVFLTAVKLWTLRKAHCSPPLVGEDNSMVFTSHSVLASREGQIPFHFLNTSDGKQILISEF